MKRSISLFLIFSLLIGSLAFPVNASESIHFVDLLSAGYITYQGEDIDNMRIVSQGSGVVYFPVTVSYALGKCELLIYSNSPDVRLFGGSEYNLELTKLSSPLGEKYYVFTGDLGGIGPRVYYTAPAGCYIYFMAAKAMPFEYKNVQVSYDLSIQTTGYNPTPVIYNQTTTSYEVHTYGEPYSFRITPITDSIVGMDYIDIDLYLWDLVIHSISASVGGKSLDIQYTETLYDSGGVNGAYYKVCLRVDISGCSMVDGLPMIFIECDSNYTSYDDPVANRCGLFHIFSIYSGLYFYSPEPEVGMLTKIWRVCKSGFQSLISFVEKGFQGVLSVLSEVWSSITSGFASLENKLEELLGQDESESEELSNELADKGSQLEQMGDAMDSSSKPASGDITMDVDSYVDDSDLSVAVAPLGGIFKTELFFSMIVMALTMATVGYILYGKR